MAVRQSFSLVFGLEFRRQAGSGLTRVRSPTVREGKLAKTGFCQQHVT